MTNAQCLIATVLPVLVVCWIEKVELATVEETTAIMATVEYKDIVDLEESKSDWGLL